MFLLTQCGNAEWEDVPRVQEARPSSPEIFDMDTEHDNAASNSSPAPIRLPPGLNIKPAVPAVQPFNMFAQQQVSTPIRQLLCCYGHPYDCCISSSRRGASFAHAAGSDFWQRSKGCLLIRCATAPPQPRLCVAALLRAYHAARAQR